MYLLLLLKILSLYVSDPVNVKNMLISFFLYFCSFLFQHYEVRIMEGKDVCYLREMAKDEEFENEQLEAGVNNVCVTS